jgi:hypothetical protein
MARHIQLLYRTKGERFDEITLRSIIFEINKTIK